MPYVDVTPVVQMTNRLRPFGQLLTSHKEKQEKCQRVLDTNGLFLLLEIVNMILYNRVKGKLVYGICARWYENRPFDSALFRYMMINGSRVREVV